MLAEHTVEARRLDWRGSSGLESLDCMGKYGHKYIMPTQISSDLAFWAEILEKVQGKQPTYNNISGLWAEKNSTKVAFTGRTQEDIHIPAGTKLICFRRESDNEKAPDLGLVYVTYDE